jgi:hypothetical protein
VDTKSVALRDFYVDDLITGVSSGEQGRVLREKISEGLQNNGFVLRKWASSDPSIIASLPSELKQDAEAFNIKDEHHSMKILGIAWLPMLDEFYFKVAPLAPAKKSRHKRVPNCNAKLAEPKLDPSSVPEQEASTDPLGSRVSTPEGLLDVTRIECDQVPLPPMTKREMLSDLSKIFDPLGLIAPVTFKLKLVMQQAWVEGVDWDTPLSDSLRSEYFQWRNDLCQLSKIRIPRCILTKNGVLGNLELHVFCDASEKGYAACIYVKVSDENHVKVSLLTAKSKVAPMKSLSIPRLELCGLVLASTLVQRVCHALKRLDIIPNQVHAWCDSTVVLAWVSNPSKTWTTFVANRVSQVQEIFDIKNLRHVRSEQNPADVASRGTSASSLTSCQMWWNGPPWLEKWCEKTGAEPQNFETSEEKRNSSHQLTLLSQVKSSPLCDVSRFSTLRKLVTTLLFVQKFVAKLKSKVKSRKGDPENFDFLGSYFTASERQRALDLVVRQDQQEHFADELKALKGGRQLSAKNQLLGLYPFIEEGIIKVGGRLALGEYLSEGQRYPVILARHSLLAKLLVYDIHISTLHAGTSVCLAELRKKFWIVNCRSILRFARHNCVKCARFAPAKSAPLMGDLPKERITPSTPFAHTGLDFGGPIYIQSDRDQKAYIAIFVCFATKALHIELVSNLTSAACIAALRRFSARRGAPSHIYSDNGTNFVGSRKELSVLQQILDTSFGRESMPNAASELGATWTTIPPRAPHWGGLWEAGVKSAKTHLKKVVGNKVLNFEELSTILCDVEAILNSRPLTPLTEDPSDELALTPSMLLHGYPSKFLPLAPAEREDQGKIPPEFLPHKRWAYIQRLVATFWKRWVKEYLHTLQPRGKWKKETPNPQVGDIVLVLDDNLPPCSGP